MYAILECIYLVGGTINDVFFLSRKLNLVNNQQLM